ncbi:MAG: c-type cytochrome [Burkholderiales bacterium]|nr:c-type cytochrome [Burkholderiales bacterium]
MKAPLALLAGCMLAHAALAQGSAPAAALNDKLVAARADPKQMERYLKLGEKTASVCASCHGPAGQSVQPDVPNLAAQNAAFVLNQLAKLGDGRRRHKFMEGIVKEMSADERVGAAVYYASQPARRLPAKDAALAARGKAIYERACKECHGDTGTGSEQVARVAGQHADYLGASIRRYKEGVRLDERMAARVRALADEDIRALTAYVASL